MKTHEKYLLEDSISRPNGLSNVTMSSIQKVIAGLSKAGFEQREIVKLVNNMIDNIYNEAFEIGYQDGFSSSKINFA